jgi:hypothetical protein
MCALASGIPAVSSNQGNGGKVLDSEPEMLMGTSQVEIEDVLSQYLTDESLRRRSAAAGATLVKETDWNVVGGRIVEAMK